MAKDNPFDRLFRLGAGNIEDPWSRDRIERFIADLDDDFFEQENDLSQYDGYRRTEVDGSVMEEVFEDGEWHVLDDIEDEQTESTVGFIETDDGYEFTVDVSEYLPVGSFDATASINNGVIRISVESVEE